jgi:acetyl-CoA carboxylase biotin carboxyl carrier protein
MIEIEYLKQVMELFDESSAQELRISHEGASIRLSKNVRHQQPQFMFPQMQSPGTGTVASPEQISTGAGTTGAAEPTAPVEDTRKYHEIRSPIVGTFYRAPNPDAPVFVEVGQEVSPGQVLCIIEAMKLMNEIECDIYGRVVKVHGENGQPVEYNQVLFLIDPS